MAFLACSTQWRRAAWDGRPLGLDYAGARAAVEAVGLRWTRVFGALRLMEAEVLAQSAES